MSWILPPRSNALRSLAASHRLLFSRSISLAAQRKQLATAEELASIPRWTQSTDSTPSPIYTLPSACGSSAESSRAPNPSPSQAGPRSIHRKLNFSSFSAAFGFMSRVALLAARLSHHPEWSNAGGTVDVRLTTDDAGGVVTALDVRMARGIDKAASECGELPIEGEAVQ